MARNASCHRLALFAALSAAVAVTPPAFGISIRDDRTFADYEALINTAPYAATGQFSNPHSGTLIDPYWVLGAAHIAGTPANFTASDGTVVSVAARVVFPDDLSPPDAIDGNDFALFRLDTPITSVAPATLHDPIASGVSYTALLGQISGLTAMYTGGGETGTGDVGAAASGSRDLLAGTNIIDSTGFNSEENGTIANIAVSDFDDPDTFGPFDNDPGTNLEMGLADKDSGGGLWVDLGNGAGAVLIGVHSGVQGDGGEIIGEYDQDNLSTILTPDAFEWVLETIAPVLGDMDGDGAFNNGDISAFVLALTDLAAYQAAFPAIDPNSVGDFDGNDALTNGDIAGFVAALTQDNSLTAQQVAVFERAGVSVPEPRSLILLALGGLACVRRRRSIG